MLFEKKALNDNFESTLREKYRYFQRIHMVISKIVDILVYIMYFFF